MELKPNRYYNIGLQITEDAKTSYVIGVDGHGWTANLPVKQWRLSDENSKATSSGSHAFYEHVLWRFELLDEDRCLIINKNSGLYLGIPDNADIGDGAILVEPFIPLNANPHELVKENPPMNIIWKMDEVGGVGKIAFYNDLIRPDTPMFLGLNSSDIQNDNAQIKLFPMPGIPSQVSVNFSVVEDGKVLGSPFLPSHVQGNESSMNDFEIALTLTSQIASMSGSNFVPLIDVLTTILGVFEKPNDPYKILYDRIMLGVKGLLSQNSINDYYGTLNTAVSNIKEIFNDAHTFNPVVVRGDVEEAIEKLKQQGDDAFVYIIYGVSVWISVADYCYKKPLPGSCYNVSESSNSTPQQIVSNMRSALRNNLNDYIHYVDGQINSILTKRSNDITFKRGNTTSGPRGVQNEHWWQINDPKKPHMKEKYINQIYPTPLPEINKWDTFYYSEAIGGEDQNSRGPAFEANFGFPKLNLDNWRVILNNWEDTIPLS